ncbi:MAG: hypothetical protein AABN95_06380, partial [Acidobacteriota bacterium]
WVLYLICASAEIIKLHQYHEVTPNFTKKRVSVASVISWIVCLSSNVAGSSVARDNYIQHAAVIFAAVPRYVSLMCQPIPTRLYSPAHGKLNN